MRLEFYDTLAPDRTVSLPAAYIVPPQWTDVIDRLRWHGVAFTRLSEPTTLQVRSYRFEDPHWRERPYEGHHPLDFKLQDITEERTFPAGSAVVVMTQPAARVAAHLLEPLGPDSMVRWGYFDAVFARVEYVESYVIEQMIPDMLRDDPGLADELAAAKAADPAFAADPGAIRDWFYRRTPYYDDRYLVYPVGMVDEEEVLVSLPLVGE